MARARLFFGGKLRDNRGTVNLDRSWTRLDWEDGHKGVFVCRSIRISTTSSSPTPGRITAMGGSAGSWKNCWPSIASSPADGNRPISSIRTISATSTTGSSGSTTRSPPRDCSWPSSRRATLPASGAGASGGPGSTWRSPSTSSRVGPRRSISSRCRASSRRCPAWKSRRCSVSMRSPERSPSCAVFRRRTAKCSATRLVWFVRCATAGKSSASSSSRSAIRGSMRSGRRI